MKTLIPSKMSYVCIVIFLLLLAISRESAGEVRLQDLIDEALKNSPEIRMAESKWIASTYRPSQTRTLPDPMFMIGYQNESFSALTFGEMPDSQWMFTVSQTVPFPGKLSLKGLMAEKEAENLQEITARVRQSIVSQIRQNYHELLLMYKKLDIINEQRSILSVIEDAAASRYASGMAPQQELLMAQLEKYMLIEKKKIIMQKIEALESMLNASMGRDVTATMGRPASPSPSSVTFSLDEYIRKALEQSPEIRARQKMIEAAEYRVGMNEKEYSPDFTFAGSVAKKEKPFEDMWSLSMAFNIPIFYKSKQRSGVLEAQSALSEARYELQAGKQMISGGIRDMYSMIRSAEEILLLYREGLIPKARQGFESVLAGYRSGKVEMAVLLKAQATVLDYELLYWSQFAEKEKAHARLDELAGLYDIHSESNAGKNLSEN